MTGQVITCRKRQLFRLRWDTRLTAVICCATLSQEQLRRELTVEDDYEHRKSEY